jgi:hypothetical protein
MNGITTFTVCAVVVGLVFATGCGKPEDKLAKHSEAMGKIMEDNLEEPKEGVEELHEYMRDNLPEMLELAGQMMVELDKIEDAKERAERAKEMAETMKSVIEKMQETGMKFGMAAATDKDSQEYGKKFMESWKATADTVKDTLPMPFPGL